METVKSPSGGLWTFLKNYSFSLLLLGSIVVGCVLGLTLGKKAVALEPLGQVLLNLLFTAVVPLVFFSIASAVAGMTNARRLGRILLYMLGIFVVTGIAASLLMLAGVLAWPVGAVPWEQPTSLETRSGSLVDLLTAGDFVQLLSRRNMMALIVFSILVGLGAGSAREKAEPFVRFLQSGSEVMMRVVRYVMYYAPVGLAAYFAAFIGRYGSELLYKYRQVMMLYYPICLGYAGVGFTFYAWLAAGRSGVRRFWANIIPAMSTALATGSSVATIPTNLAAADRMGTPREVSEIVIPIGATVHMDGSCMASLLKIAFLYALFGTPFTGLETWAFAVAIAILAGMVTSGVPVGGFVGEAFLVSVYSAQFPDAVKALPLLQTIGVLVDPPATMVNAVGDNVVSMLVARILGRKTGTRDHGLGTRD